MYTQLLLNFATRNRVYLDIRSEKGYSYNFHRNYKDNANDNIQVGFGTTVVSQIYETNSWPILFSDANQPNSAERNSIRFKLRTDDNEKPLIYYDVYGEVIRRQGEKNAENLFVESNLSPSGEWTRQIIVNYPQRIEGTDHKNIATYIRIYYFRQNYNIYTVPFINPPGVFKAQKYYDSAFCSIDSLNIANQATSKWSRSFESSEPVYIHEPLQTDGTGNFGLVAKNGAHWDNQRILFYATRFKKVEAMGSGKFYLNTYEGKLKKIDSEAFNSQLGLHAKTNFICRTYNTNEGLIKILGINSYKTGKKYLEKEDALMLGLTISEINSLKDAIGLSADHPRYLYLEPITGNPQVDTNHLRYFKYRVKVQGFDLSGNSQIVAPAGIPPFSDIIVYSRDNQFFHSSAFSSNENVTTGENRVEFHIYHDGTIKINDNIDLSLVRKKIINNNL